MPMPADPQTTSDDDDLQKVDNRGVSAPAPAEGSDDEPAEQPGSPRG